MVLVGAQEVRNPHDPVEDAFWRFVGMDWVWVEFDKDDLKKAKAEARNRTTSRTGSANNFAKGSRAEGDLHGAAAEMAVGYATGLRLRQWGVLRNFNNKLPDVGNDIEAKATKYGENWKMYINQSTFKPQCRYVLVMTYLYPQYVALIGWQHGSYMNLKPFAPLPFRTREKACHCHWHELNKMESFIGRHSC